MPHLENASQFPRLFYARHMQPGVCGYENEKVLVDTDAIKNMMPSAIGKPVYVKHQNVDLANIKEEAAGFIVESFYNELDGWAWFKILAVDDECHNSIAKGWSVSNAYRPLQFGGGGTKNNCPYDREIMNGEFTHLAIVPNPRYEEALIMSPEKFKNYQEGKKKQLEELHNDKTPKGKQAMKFFNLKKEEASTVTEDTMMDVDGENVSVGEMLNAARATKAAKLAADKKNAKEEKINGDTEVDCDGEKMTLNALKAAYKNMKEKKNAEDEETEKKKKAKEEEDKKNAEEEDKKKKETEKENAKLEEMRNAHLKSGTTTTSIETSQDKVKRGQDKYGVK